MIDLESASTWNAQTARRLHPGEPYSQTTELYGDDYEKHAYSGKKYILYIAILSVTASANLEYREKIRKIFII